VVEHPLDADRGDAHDDDRGQPAPDPGLDREPAPATSPIGRRIVLSMLGLGAGGILVGSKVQDGLERIWQPVTERDPTGLAQLVPTAGRFRIYSVVDFSPHRSDTEYRLKVDGLVDNKLTLSLADLKDRPAAQLKRDFQCVTGWRVPDVPWTGVRLRDLLDEAGVQDKATHLRLYSFDESYTESLTLEEARRDDVIAAYRMLDGPVTQEHGGPVRLYVAPMYGYKSLKWLDRIEVVDREIPGYWEERGYDVEAWVGKSNGLSGDDPT
jgi:DMSO/TMAO reductase YedYZ molybdopterin-dependent catalytic subunit